MPSSSSLFLDNLLQALPFLRIVSGREPTGRPNRRLKKSPLEPELPGEHWQKAFRSKSEVYRVNMEDVNKSEEEANCAYAVLRLLL